MPVVSNTSPVLNLAIIGQLSLLREQFGEIWIPAAVVEELRVEEDLPGPRGVREAMEAGWLRVEEVNLPPCIQTGRPVAYPLMDSGSRRASASRTRRPRAARRRESAATTL